MIITNKQDEKVELMNIKTFFNVNLYIYIKQFIRKIVHTQNKKNTYIFKYIIDLKIQYFKYMIV